jgi:bifunctional NMN adenylyltransferase/nudix hydrolase
MEIAQKKKYNVGVIVGRFQVPGLHSSHLELLEYVASKHEKVVLLLGVSPVLGSKRNPLDFVTRKVMIEKSIVGKKISAILPLCDRSSDEVWSKELDEKVLEVFPLGSKVIYGARDSFIPHYTGKFDTCELSTNRLESGTQYREGAASCVLASKEFRAGAIYATYNTYPTAYPVIDALILNENNEIILGRKPNETKWRFIGGFVDPTDSSLEMAVKREVSEETGVEVGELAYLTSTLLDDWRYRSEPDRAVISSVFVCKYIYGDLTPMDDIVALEWIDLDSLHENLGLLISGHREIFERQFKNIKKFSEHYKGIQDGPKEEGTE